jgi:hypothetical protein
MRDMLFPVVVAVLALVLGTVAASYIQLAASAVLP